MSGEVNLNVETSEVVRGLRRGVELAPDDANAHLLLGTALAEAGQLAEALGHLQRAVELAPSLVRGHIRSGNLLRELRTGEAGEAYGRSLELRPADPFILSNLGNAWLDLSAASRAIDCYRRSLEIHPAAPTTFSNLVFAMQYDSGISREEIAAAHWEWGGRFGQAGRGFAGEVATLAADGSRWVRAGIDGGSRGAGHGLTVTQSMSCRSAYSESTRSFSIRMARTIDDSSAWPMCGK